MSGPHKKTKYTPSRNEMIEQLIELDAQMYQDDIEAAVDDALAFKKEVLEKMTNTELINEYYYVMDEQTGE